MKYTCCIIFGLVRFYDKVQILNLLLNFNNKEQLNYKRVKFKTERGHSIYRGSRMSSLVICVVWFGFNYLL
jgi:hypothetical protein